MSEALRSDVLCYRFELVSGRKLLRAERPWPEDEALKDAPGIREHDGTYWIVLTDEEGAEVLRAHGYNPGRYLPRWLAYEEV